LCLIVFFLEYIFYLIKQLSMQIKGKKSQIKAN